MSVQWDDGMSEDDNVATQIPLVVIVSLKCVQKAL